MLPFKTHHILTITHCASFWNTPHTDTTHCAAFQNAPHIVLPSKTKPCTPHIVLPLKTHHILTPHTVLPFKTYHILTPHCAAFQNLPHTDTTHMLPFKSITHCILLKHTVTERRGGVRHSISYVTSKSGIVFKSDRPVPVSSHIRNNLPQDIRHSATLSSFKSQLKTFLFSEYFS